MRNLINKDAAKVASEITTYLEELIVRTNEKLDHSTSLPVQQHMVPKFILNLIAAQNPANVTKEKGLLLKEHKIEYNPATNEVDDFIASKEPVSPKSYSVRSKIYNSSSFEHDFFMETMFSMIETDAARLIRSKAAEQYDPSTAKEYNPFYFSLPEYNPKPSKMRARVILSTFFTIQFLRSERRKEALATISLKHGMNATDFAGNIMNHLLRATIQTYCRQWTWIRVPNHEMFISELGLVTVASCCGPAASIMPISRRDFIYLHEIVDSHFEIDDKLVYSTSSIMYDWYVDSLLKQIANIETKETINGNYEISFVSNKEATFSKFTLYKTRECCFSCVLEPIRSDPRNELFLGTDYDSGGNKK